MKGKTQEERVLEYMLAAGGITTWEAIREFGVTRLSAKIYNLKKAGWRIGVEHVTRRNRYGNKVTFARYFVLQSLQAGQEPPAPAPTELSGKGKRALGSEGKGA